MKCFGVICALFVLLSQWLVVNHAERIMVLAPICTKSQRISFFPIVEALAKKGHQLTVVSPYRYGFEVENITEIVLENVLHELKPDWFELQKKWSFLNVLNAISQINNNIQRIRTMMKQGYAYLMENEEFQKILQSRTVDKVIVNSVWNDFTLPIVDSLKVPIIFYSPTSNKPSIFCAVNDRNVTGENESKIMAFLERVGTKLYLWFRKFLFLNMLDELVSKDFPNSRHISEIEGSSHLCIINILPSTTAWSRQLPKNVISIGALHLQKASQTLPISGTENLQILADNATQGFIIFSLGSAIPVSSMPDNIIRMFVNVFARIPKVQVFWNEVKSGDEPLENLSANVMMVESLPQRDLLAHDKVRLFISQGGLLGIQETVYHGVPILGLPFGDNQRSNLAKVREEGYGIILEWDELTEDLLYGTIQLLLNDASYRGNAKRLSKLMKDRLVHDREEIVNWVEHSLPHGGKQLNSESKDMPFYQIHSLDVLLFLFISIFTIVFVTLKSLTWIASKIKSLLLRILRIFIRKQKTE